MKLRLYQPHYVIANLAAIPPSLHDDLAGSLYSLTISEEEISLICEQHKINSYDTTKLDTDWRLFRMEGQLSLNMTGIIAATAKVLAQHEISIVVVSSYNTDCILLRATRCDDACAVLRESGYIIVPHGKQG